MLPVLFVCENNRYATFSDQLKRQASDNICERVAAFGVRSHRIFGNDVALAYRTLKEEIERVRGGHGPSLVEAYTFRLNSHVGPEDDSVNNYRTAAQMQFWKDNCPIVLLEEKLRAAGLYSDAAREVMEREIAAEVAENFLFAKSTPFPAKADWHAMNWNDASPEADRLLGSSFESDFDQYQPEAKLEPY
jgi:pyruvate dehydrogenase E1 component alpha subunit